MHPEIAFHLAVKRTAADLKRVQPFPHLSVRGFGKTAARLPHRNQKAVVVIESQYNGAEVFAGAARIGVASNDALLPLDDFDLQPVATALLHIGTAAQLRDDSFQSLMRRRLKQ